MGCGFVESMVERLNGRRGGGGGSNSVEPTDCWAATTTIPTIIGPMDEVNENENEENERICTC
jgi:hypothetical protein